jgi:hypothetical protein
MNTDTVNAELCWNILDYLQVSEECSNRILAIEYEYAQKKRGALLERSKVLRTIPHFWKKVSAPWTVDPPGGGGYVGEGQTECSGGLWQGPVHDACCWIEVSAADGC